MNDARQPNETDPNAPDGRGARASSLDLTDAALAELSEGASRLAVEYFKGIAERPVFPEIRGGALLGQLKTEMPEDGAPLAEILDECRAIVDAARHNGHPRFFGYVASPSTPVGAFADLIASALNQNVTSWRSTPSGTEVEQVVVRWLGALIGYGEQSSGILTSGGSLANLTALHVAQRTHAEPGTARTGLWNSGPPMTLYASDQVHFSIPKAADALGIGRDQVRLVRTDAQFRIDVSALRESITRDLSAGLRPFCVVANAGTVSTGAVDPIRELAAVAREFKLWFHVDGAYGALAALDPRKRELFEGLELADSVALDAHKWLYAPVDCGSLLFRDAAAARSVFQTASGADYIAIHEKSPDEAFAFWDYGLELSRRFRALKLWMMLRYYGARRVRASISDDNALAAYLGALVAGSEDFELLAPVTFSICCFRYVPEAVRGQLQTATEPEREQLNRRLNELNERVMHAVQRGGQVYLSNANLNGLASLRVCITNFRTTPADIEATLETVRAEGRKLSEQMGWETD